MAERIISEEDYPSNSHRKKVEASSLDRVKTTRKEKEIRRVVKRPVKTKKRSLGKRVTETFIGESERESALDYIIEVLVNAAKDTISDMVTGGIEMLLFGETRGRSSSSRNRNKTRVSYSSMYNSEDRNYRHVNRRNRFELDDILFETRSEANEVLEYMIDILDEYEVVTVNDLYLAVGINASYNDLKWGWTELGRSDIRRVRDGYVIDFPKPKPIDY